MAKNLPAIRETWVQSLGQEDSLEKEGNGNPLQYSGLENSVDRGARQATVHGVTKSRTRLSGYHSDFTGAWVGEAVRGQCCWNRIMLGFLVRGPLGKMPLGEYLLMEHLSMTCNKVANYA